MDMARIKNRGGVLLAAVFALLLCGVPATGWADSGLVVKQAESGQQVVADKGIYSLSGGSYIVSGTSDGSESISISGDVELTLDGAQIKRAEGSSKPMTEELLAYTPAISIESGAVKIELAGDNELQGSPGYAGIYVAKGASLSIAGSGALLAQGGAGGGVVRNVSIKDYTSVYWGGAAGIGGNGDWVSGSDERVFGESYNCGTVTVNGGSVTALGGKSSESNAGAGAGIGTGGLSTSAPETDGFKGTISIAGGTVDATGGDGQSMSLTGGGAGIGTGGAIGGDWSPSASQVDISISDGEVSASGLADGAGIGGGANVGSGSISISGGTVNALGGGEFEDGVREGAYGGAGIGGGDNGGTGSIEITGGKVVAAAQGAGAGIGNGNDGYVEPSVTSEGIIHIGGAADVLAYGGSHATKDQGGAGIGGGRSYYVNSGYTSIVIDGAAAVHAFGGKAAQGIGVGTYYENANQNKVSISSTASVWAVTSDTEWRAIYGDDSTLETPGLDLIATKYADASEVPAAGDAVDVTSAAGKTYSCSYGASAIHVKSGDTDKATLDLPEGYTPANWATTLQSTKTVKIVCDNGEDEKDLTVESGDTIDRPSPDPQRAGYRFAGWFQRSADGTLAETEFDFTQPITEDLELVAKWVKVHSVTFDDGCGNKTTTQVDDGAQVAAPQDPTCDGYTFAGWWDNATLSGNKFDFSQPVTGDLVLHAGWYKNGTTPSGKPSAKPSVAGDSKGTDSKGAASKGAMPKTGDNSILIVGGVAVVAVVCIALGIMKWKASR